MRQNFGLATEARQVFGIVNEGAGQNLQRNAPPKVGILCRVDSPTPPRPEAIRRDTRRSENRHARRPVLDSVRPMYDRGNRCLFVREEPLHFAADIRIGPTEGCQPALAHKVVRLFELAPSFGCYSGADPHPNLKEVGWNSSKVGCPSSFRKTQ